MFSSRRLWQAGALVVGALALMGQSCTPASLVAEIQSVFTGGQCTVPQTRTYFVDATKHAKTNGDRCQGGPLGVTLPDGTYNFRYLSGRYDFDTRAGGALDKQRDYIGVAFFDQGQWHETSIGGLQHCDRGLPCQSGVMQRTHHVSGNGGQPNVHLCVDYPQSTIAHGNKAGGINIAVDTLSCDVQAPPLPDELASCRAHTQYDAGAATLPETQGWQRNQLGTGHNPSVVSGTHLEGTRRFVKILDTTQTGSIAYFMSLPTNLLHDADWVYEIEARIKASAVNIPQSSIGTNMFFAHVDTNRIGIYLDTNRLGPPGTNQFPNFSYARTHSFNTTDDFHTYRIYNHKNGAGLTDDTFDVVVDGQVVMAGIGRNEVFRDVPASVSSALVFGIGSTPGTGEMDVSRVRFYSLADCLAQANEDPVADLAISTGTPVFGNPVTLDGSGSRDPDGEITSWVWTITTTEPRETTSQLSGETVEFIGGVEGPHTVTLTVTDDDGATATATSSFNNADDAIAASVSTSGSRVNEPVRLDGSASVPQGRLTYAWSVRDPSGGAVEVASATSPIASFVPPVPGTYPITLTVTDNRGRTDSQTVHLQIGANPFDPGDLKEVE